MHVAENTKPLCMPVIAQYHVLKSSRLSFSF